MIFWLTVFIALCLVILPRLMNKSGSMREFNKRARKIRTDENKDSIEQLVVFHKQRMEAGANAQNSLERMMKDLKRMEGIEEEKKEEPNAQS